MELISVNKDLRLKQQSLPSVILMVHLLPLWFPKETEAENCCRLIIVLNRPFTVFLI